MAQVNLQLGVGQLPGPATRRSNANVGAGMEFLGQSLTHAANQWSKLEKTEDPLLGMNLYTAYTQEYLAGIEELKRIETNFKSYNRRVFEFTKDLQEKYSKTARESNVGEFFAQRATPWTITSQAEALKHGTLLAENYSKSLLGLADQTALQSITGGKGLDQSVEDRVPTLLNRESGKPTKDNPEAPEKLTLRLANEGTMRSVLHNYLEDLRVAATYDPKVNVTEKQIDMAKKLKDTILTSAARSHHNVFSKTSVLVDEKNEKLKVDFNYVVPIFDPETGKEVDYILNPTYEDVVKMGDTARSYRSSLLSDASSKRAEIKAQEEKNDKELMGQVVSTIYDPNTTYAEKEALRRDLLSGKTLHFPNGISGRFMNEEERESALNKLHALFTSGGPPRQNNPEVISNTRFKLYGDEPVTQEEIDHLYYNSNDATFAPLFSLWQNQKATGKAKVDKGVTNALKGIDELIGNLPGGDNQEGAFVSRIIKDRFLDLIEMIPRSELNLKEINNIRSQVLQEALPYLLTESRAFASESKAPKAIQQVLTSQFESEDDIDNAVRDPNDPRIPEDMDVSNLKFYFRLGKAAQGNLGLDPQSKQKELDKGIKDKKWLLDINKIQEENKKLRESLRELSKSIRGEK